MKRRGERDALGQALLFDAERHCVLCGLRLRGDLSVKRQYGPRCWRRRCREVTPPNLKTVGENHGDGC